MLALSGRRKLSSESSSSLPVSIGESKVSSSKSIYTFPICCMISLSMVSCPRKQGRDLERPGHLTKWVQGALNCATTRLIATKTVNRERFLRTLPVQQAHVTGHNRMDWWRLYRLHRESTGREASTQRTGRY